jgi:hypothetical protein
MSKARSIHSKQARLEADGETHRRDCECARCDAGFSPSEREREVAGRRVAGKQGRRAAERASERRKETARLKQLELALFFQQTNARADAEVQRLRALRVQAASDRRMDEFLRLRKDGLSVELALAEVDRRFPAAGPSGADNDNGQAAAERTNA